MPHINGKKWSRKRHQMSKEALRESLRAVGQLVPVFTHCGRVVDGSRRQSILYGLGRVPKVVELGSRREAAQLLFQLHPAAAFEEYADQGAGLHDLAQYFGVSVADVANVRALITPQLPTRYGAWRARYKRSFERVQAYLASVRQGTVELTIGGVERAMALPPWKGEQ